MGIKNPWGSVDPRPLNDAPEWHAQQWDGRYLSLCTCVVCCGTRTVSPDWRCRHGDDTDGCYDNKTLQQLHDDASRLRYQVTTVSYVIHLVTRPIISSTCYAINRRVWHVLRECKVHVLNNRCAS